VVLFVNLNVLYTAYVQDCEDTTDDPLEEPSENSFKNLLDDSLEDPFEDLSEDPFTIILRILLGSF
jgi:hypothetical protein